LPFELTILGSNSAIPIHGRHHTAQYLKIQNHHFLIDCGEGTQLQLQHYGLKAQRLEAIFISHLHGDHYLGLVGLLSSLHLQGRTKDLHLFGPHQLSEIITTQLRYSQTTFRYPLHFHPLNMDDGQVIFENNKFSVTTIPLQHRIPCVGFIFQEKPHPLIINKEKLPVDISFQEMAGLKKGVDILDDSGNVMYKAKDLTHRRKKSRSYAYCSDTLYVPALAKTLKDVDILYHEATFLTEKELKATNTYHATAGQAAQLAKDATVGKLLIGHFSARYKNLIPLQEEARKIFKKSYLAIEGHTFIIKH
jgi:ribonuclease Z